MKVSKRTIRGVDDELYQEAMILKIKLNVSIGQIINEALRLRLKKEKTK